MAEHIDSEHEVTVLEVRGIIDGNELSDEFVEALDRAQGDAMGSGKPHRLLLIVKPE